MFGEANRCPHCNAIAAVRPSGDGVVCVACSKPREMKKGTVVLGAAGPFPTGAVLPDASGDPVAVRRAQAAAGTGASMLMRGFGVFSMAAGVLGAGAVAVLLWPVSVAAAAAAATAVGVTGIGVGIASFAAGGKSSAAADDRRRTARELAIMALAEEKGGELTATDVARELHIRADEADAALTAMADGTRVDVIVSPDGILRYQFREIQQAGEVPRVRVATDEPMSAEEEEEALEALREELGHAPREREQEV